MNPNERMAIEELEQHFDLLHGNGNYLRNESNQRVDANTLKIRKQINSHDFKYSMIPFSVYNNS